jgi:periplasmic divalent cation tolerance protein
MRSMFHPTNAVVVLTTWPADQDWSVLADALIASRLAACVSVLPPMRSTYRWQETIERTEECQVLIKTTAARVEDLEERLSALHPYSTPELLVIPVAGGGADYLAWLADSTTPTSS